MSLEFATVFSNPSTGLRVYDYVLDSKDRVNYTTTDANNFKLDLGNPVPGRLVAYALKAVIIPKTNYNIPATRNTFTFFDGVANYTITVPAGNYTMAELLLEIQTLLNALGPNTFTLTYSSISGKTNWTTTGPPMIINPSLDTTEGSILYKLGFEPGQLYTGVNITAPNVSDISGAKSGFIRIKQLTQYVRNSVNTMYNFKFDLQGQFGDIIFFTDEGKYHQYFIANKDNIASLGSFDILLTNEYGELLDLNGRDWNFTLQIITAPN